MSKRKEIPNVMNELQGLGAAPPQKEAQPTPPAQPAPERVRPRRRSKNRTPKSRLKGRATYDIGYELKEVIRQESIDLGVPASQLAKYLLLYAWELYLDEQIPAPPLQDSNSPKFRNTIIFSE